MGAGSGRCRRGAGSKVGVRHMDQCLVGGGLCRFREPLAKRVEKGKMTAAEVDGILAKIRGVVDLKEAVAGAQIVIEAVFEKMDIKRGPYAELDRPCPPRRVFSSDTSALSITEVATPPKTPRRPV